MKKDKQVTPEEEDAMAVAALAKIGLRVASVYDLVNLRSPYPSAIPILINLLPRVQSDRIKEGIARALTVREARPIAAKPLINEFETFSSKTKSEEHTRWAIGNAIGACADDSVFEDVVRILLNERYGWMRSGVVSALGNMKKNREKVVSYLRQFLRDQNLAVQAIDMLGRMRVCEVRDEVAHFLQHEDSWVRQHAKRALAKLDKAC